MAYTIEYLDILSDWIQIIKNDLRSDGYATIASDLDEILVQHFSLQKRLIPVTPRIVHRARTFICPHEMQVGLALLEEKISNGLELKPHLSRLVKKLNKRDELLFDWGIYHLHLGENIENDGYVSRTGPVLFARFDNRNVYFINVTDHGSWSEQQMLKVIHDNWPQTISNFRLKDVIGVEQNFSNEDVGNMRKAHINTAIEIEPGVVYMGPGGGFVASGHSLDVMMKIMDNKRAIKILEKRVKDTFTELIVQQHPNLTVIKEELIFKLRFDNNKIILDEQNNSFSIRIT